VAPGVLAVTDSESVEAVSEANLVELVFADEVIVVLRPNVFCRVPLSVRCPDANPVTAADGYMCINQYPSV
jgi:hypothetical protein